MRIAAAVIVAACVLALGACSAPDGTRAVDSAAADGATPSAGSGRAPRPLPEGEVRTSGLVTVLDDGDGPRLCLGAVAESYPPQCGGPAIADFDWGEVGVETAGGVTWGQYALSGGFDGSTFTVTDAVPAALYDSVAAPRDALGAACENPSTTDPAKEAPEDLDATLAAASALPGYASAWLTGDTINVAVTADEQAAERALRRTWGGALCVTRVERTDADLTEVNQELQTALGDQLLTSGSFAPDSLDAQVVFDDGSIQAWADATWGDGLVRVGSALEPAR